MLFSEMNHIDNQMHSVEKRMSRHPRFLSSRLIEDQEELGSIQIDDMMLSPADFDRIERDGIENHF